MVRRLVRCLVLALLLAAAGLAQTGAAAPPWRHAAGGGTESLAQLPSPSRTAGPVKVVFRLPVAKPAVFITIDDGWYPDPGVLALMEKYHLPVTAFLIEKAAGEHPDFWRRFVRAGGHLEDHTVDHPFLTRVPPPAQYREIAAPLDYFSQFGPRPDELRPPYGDYNPAVGLTARKAGIRYIVLWDAEMRGGRLHTIRNQPLQAGDIVLLHWVPGLTRDLDSLLSLLARSHLGVADLTQALAGTGLTVVPAPAPPATGPSLPRAPAGRRVRGTLPPGGSWAEVGPPRGGDSVGVWVYGKAALSGRPPGQEKRP